jgi:hypothetical protein
MMSGIPLTGLAIGGGGFILGYFAKTVISYEYKSIREGRKQRVREIESWEQETELLLTELRQLLREFVQEKRPDINDWIEQLDYHSKQLERTTAKAPDGISDELEEELLRLAGLCDAHETVVSDLYIEIYGESDGRDELPLPFEYDEVAKDEDIQTDRLFRHMCEHIQEETLKEISEVEELLESPRAENHILIQIKRKVL